MKGIKLSPGTKHPIGVMTPANIDWSKVKGVVSVAEDGRSILVNTSELELTDEQRKALESSLKGESMGFSMSSSVSPTSLKVIASRFYGSDSVKEVTKSPEFVEYNKKDAQLANNFLIQAQAAERMMEVEVLLDYAEELEGLGNDPKWWKNRALLLEARDIRLEQAILVDMGLQPDPRHEQRLRQLSDLGMQT